ncbi:RES domain-containing protein [Lysobacter korlensis]|uniref:RES domain-containing protein n=1 Tax=Lysobacter korlensis TaxID=553636 RepID=A0ABV6RRC1_9GAMM
MSGSICYRCIDDAALANIVRQEGERSKCTVCGGRRRAFDTATLGRRVADAIRENFRLGTELRIFADADDDRGYFEQQGDALTDVVQEVLGQYLPNHDEIVDAVVDSDDYWPPDGDEPFFDEGFCYEPIGPDVSHMHVEWRRLQAELRHERRFFNAAIRTFFDGLFEGLEGLGASTSLHTDTVERPVRRLPANTLLFRFRATNGFDLTQQIFREPAQHMGAPPPDKARDGRMNAEGVPVFYAAMEKETALAEMRPAIGASYVYAQFATTKDLVVLDFRLLERARSHEVLSYFQEDYSQELSRRAFLRRFHAQIARPIVPGRESEYLITQAMLEYLTSERTPRVDAVLFNSVQKAGGTNIVLVPRATEFPVCYVQDSVGLCDVTGITYSHVDVATYVHAGRLHIGEDSDDSDWW